jgi:hypothetical protein
MWACEMITENLELVRGLLEFVKGSSDERCGPVKALMERCVSLSKNLMEDVGL